MKFYHSFHTDLPDQFVEANAEQLIKWTSGWKDKNRYYRRAMIVDMVAIDFLGDAKRHDWPELRASSTTMLNNWMLKKGANYNGRYWETLAEDQRSPPRVAGDPWGKSPAISAQSIYSRTLSQWASAQQAAAAGAGGIVWFGGDFAERPKPPLKREGIIAGEIVGYRCWRIERGVLRSVYQTDVWQPGQVLEGRELGDWDQRGIHAWKDGGSKQYHDYIRAYLNQQQHIFPLLMSGRERDADLTPAMVTGTVFLWGDVVVHERGYRAEFARVRSLDWLYPDASMMGRERQALDELRARYAINDI